MRAPWASRGPGLGYQKDGGWFSADPSPKWRPPVRSRSSDGRVVLRVQSRLDRNKIHKQSGKDDDLSGLSGPHGGVWGAENIGLISRGCRCLILEHRTIAFPLQTFGDFARSVSTDLSTDSVETTRSPKGCSGTARFAIRLPCFRVIQSQTRPRRRVWAKGDFVRPGSRRRSLPRSGLSEPRSSFWEDA